MKNSVHFGFLILGFLLLSCQTPTDQEVIKNLNGYWKIHAVQQIDGTVKEYSFSTNIDYIEIDSNNEGFRLKVQPQPDSTYITSKKAEHFQVKKENDSLKFYYETPMDNWTETLLNAKKDEFTVKNERGITYTYKRFKSLQDEFESH